MRDYTNGQGYMILWTEDKAKRNADEIAFVILKFISNRNSIENLVSLTAR